MTSEMSSPAPVGESLDALIGRLAKRAEELPEPDTPPEDPAIRQEAETRAREKRWLREVCEDWGVPFQDARAILGGDLWTTDALTKARRWREKCGERAFYGAVLVLGGPNGCGKTFAAAWLTTQGPPAPYPYGDRWPRHRHPRMISSSDIMRMSMYGDDKTWDALRSCAVLAIDDVGLDFDDDKGAFATKLSSLIAFREKAPVWTVMTTNLPLRSKNNEPSFSQRVGNRILSRIHGDGCGYVHLQGEDLREKRTT